MIVDHVLNARNIGQAAQLARRATDQPIGRFLYALALSRSGSFRLALEATAEDEWLQCDRANFGGSNCPRHCWDCWGFELDSVSESIRLGIWEPPQQLG